MYTIRDLCKIANLSRSTILYYDYLGLLKPAERSAANYRLYSDESIDTIKRICLYREAGVSLKDIGVLLSIPENSEDCVVILEDTLSKINSHIRELQKKQQIIVGKIKTANSKNIIDDMEFSDYLINQITMHDGYDINKATGLNNGDDD